MEGHFGLLLHFYHISFIVCVILFYSPQIFYLTIHSAGEILCLDCHAFIHSWYPVRFTPQCTHFNPLLITHCRYRWPSLTITHSFPSFPYLPSFFLPPSPGCGSDTSTRLGWGGRWADSQILLRCPRQSQHYRQVWWVSPSSNAMHHLHLLAEVKCRTGHLNCPFLEYYYPFMCNFGISTRSSTNVLFCTVHPH